MPLSRTLLKGEFCGPRIMSLLKQTVSSRASGGGGGRAAPARGRPPGRAAPRPPSWLPPSPPASRSPCQQRLETTVAFSFRRAAHAPGARALIRGQLETCGRLGEPAIWHPIKKVFLKGSSDIYLVRIRRDRCAINSNHTEKRIHLLIPVRGRKRARGFETFSGKPLGPPSSLVRPSLQRLVLVFVCLFVLARRNRLFLTFILSAVSCP